LGKNHLATATALNTRASIYSMQGRYADAEPLYKRSLAIKEKALGASNPNVATGLNNLALHYEGRGLRAAMAKAPKAIPKKAVENYLRAVDAKNDSGSGP
jgi:tetratricopeptide (TPR) repeat protein